MTRISVDADLANELNTLSEPAELCDPSGKVLGRFFPEIDMSEWEPVTPEASEEELDRAEQSPQWYTSEEVFARFREQEGQ